MSRCILGVISLVVGMPSPATVAIAQPVLFVDDDAADGGDGSSWAGAFNKLQDAFAAAANPATTEIRVAQGVYKPDQGGGATPGDREATFQLFNRLTVQGGYAGIGEPDPDARNIGLYETILSGDLKGDDGSNFENNTENSFQIVNGNFTNATAVIDGFTLTGGNADGFLPFDGGGGMIVFEGDPTILNCTFHHNFAANFGGGLFNEKSSSLVVNCKFHDNDAFLGGGMHNLLKSHPIIINCEFVDNTAFSAAGMVNITDCHPLIMNCSFIGNAALVGGGMRNVTRTDSLLINCLFSGNSANVGGGLQNKTDSNARLINCTLYGNQAAFASGGGGILNENSSPVMSNIILWANSDDGGANTDESAQMQTNGGAPVVNYSCIQGLTGDLGGTGNIGGDPQFVDADGLDDVPGTRDDNLRLGPGSACIDAGDNLSVPADTEDVDEDGDFDEPVPIDLDFHARFVDDPATPDSGNPLMVGPIPVVDIGSYEYLAGDSDGDGDADLSDYFGFQECLTGPGGGVTPECDVFDLDDDGDVDLQDWGYLQASFTGPK